ncbi:hypothetical protein Tcan_12853 [Toxocara canis]|uniref:Uncharacterized protein n=1 Tax=Toxocara canis TaxID=6265 RepID=A0A0B2UT68_TOXCA|nr:hypothetical protein Tcan_12853 [Toxocara canis]
MSLAFVALHIYFDCCGKEMLKSALVNGRDGTITSRQSERRIPLKAHFRDIPPSPSSESPRRRSLDQLQLLEQYENCPVKVEICDIESSEAEPKAHESSVPPEGYEQPPIESSEAEPKAHESSVPPEGYEQPPVIVKIVVCFIAFVIMVLCLGMLFIKFE